MPKSLYSKRDTITARREHETGGNTALGLGAPRLGGLGGGIRIRRSKQSTNKAQVYARFCFGMYM